MAPVLYMIPLSPPSRAVLITAEALALELDVRNVDLSRGDNRKEEYLKLNPLHSVPTLVDDDVIISDSHAINAYLVNKYGKNDGLYPKDCAKRAMVDQRLHFDTGILFNQFRNAVAPLFYRKRNTVSEEDANRILETYKVLEIYLGETSWIAGNSVTIADFSVATSTTALDILVSLRPDLFPNTISWIKKHEELAYAKVNGPGLNLLKEIIAKCMS